MGTALTGKKIKKFEWLFKKKTLKIDYRYTGCYKLGGDNY